MGQAKVNDGEGWGRVKMQERCGEVGSGSECKGFELEVPNFNITRVKKKKSTEIF